MLSYAGLVFVGHPAASKPGQLAGPNRTCTSAIINDKKLAKKAFKNYYMKPITVGGREYILHYVTGTVEETGKNMETRVSGGGGGGATYGGYGGTAPVTIRSQTVVHDQLFVTDASGAEHSFQLQDFNLACRTGHKVSVIWAIKKGKPTGKYICVVNHTTNNNFYNEKALKNVFRYNLWYFIGGGAVVGWVLFGRGIGGVVMGAMLSVIAWALVWDRAKFNNFKATVATDVLAG